MRNRLPPTSDVIIWLSLVSVWVASFVYASTPLNGEIFCVWRRTLDLNCFGCGLTRSFMMVSDGQFVGAFRRHPVGPLLYAAMMWHVLVPALRVGLGRPELAQLPTWVVRVFWVTAGLLFLGNGAVVVHGWTT